MRWHFKITSNSEAGVHFDPYDPTLQLNPYPTYQWLRDESPAHWDPGRGFWTLSRFEDVWSAVHDPLRLSSAQGIVIGQSDIGASNLMEAMPMMIMMDPPRHDELRRLVSRAFTPRAIAQMENAVRCTTRQLLEDLPEGRADLLPTFAGPLPVTVIAEMLGVPVDDRENFREWSDMLVRINPDEPESVDRALHGSAELFGYLPPLIQARRRKPKDDLLSAMVAAEHQGRRMTDEEIAGTAFLLLTAGNETTTNLIANMAMIVGTDADLRRTLIDDPSLIPAAAEEVLRLESPVQGLARTATEDVAFGDATIEEGQQVLLLFAAANRDEREFPHADSLLLDRRSDRALAFGHGIHFCLGATLARLEVCVAFEELLQHLPDFAVGEGARRVPSALVRGFEHLPIEYELSTVQGAT